LVGSAFVVIGGAIAERMEVYHSFKYEL
jgi:hypothetical protein